MEYNFRVIDFLPTSIFLAYPALSCCLVLPFPSILGGPWPFGLGCGRASGSSCDRQKVNCSTMLKVFIEYFVNLFVNRPQIVILLSLPCLRAGTCTEGAALSVQREGLADSAGLQARPQTLYNRAVKKLFMVIFCVFSALGTDAVICWQNLTFYVSNELCGLTDWLLP